MNALNSNRRTDFIICVSQLSFAVLIGILALGVSVTALMHAVDPEHFGPWVSKTMFVFGGLEDPTMAREVLGDKIYLYAAAGALIAIPTIWEQSQAALKRFKQTAGV
ncbi:hypothetical protein [Undibacterium curvum]|uniref:Uncharacterized protein n=1 Tax=Undibacterium curvum TaxID=2762294 RepID=A0ABR7A156_9BURK|nr:hypothetical protein [Undibacterium curvum]MBC3930433.1 hypothetical protein [Undibacterium curvum]